MKITNLKLGGTIYNFEKGERLADINDYVLRSDFPVGFCPKCGEPLVIRNGKYGKFIACSNFKNGCKNTYNLKNFKTISALEVSRIPSKRKACTVHWSIRKVGGHQ